MKIGIRRMDSFEHPNVVLFEDCWNYYVELTVDADSVRLDQTGYMGAGVYSFMLQHCDVCLSLFLRRFIFCQLELCDTCFIECNIVDV